MAISLNRVQLVGNLGRDPEIRELQNGSRVATLNMATTESYKDKTSGEWKETTDWHRVVCWDNLAQTAEKNLKKGSKVMIEGKLKTRSYQDQKGETRYQTDVQCTSIILLERTSSGSSFNNDSDNHGGRYSENNYQEQNSHSSNSKSEDIDDDEVPF